MITAPNIDHDWETKGQNGQVQKYMEVSTNNSCFMGAVQSI